MALTEYSIVYTKTNQAAKSTQGSTVQLAKSGFALSGNTNLNIGQITRITFRHKHSNGGYHGWWATTGRMYFGDGTSIKSDTIRYEYNGNQKWTTNTFSSGLPTPEKFATWTRMDLIPSNNSGSGTLQWWATASEPITITVYFYKYEDLIVDADPPTTSGVTIEDSTGYSTTYGNPVQGRSNLTITGQYALDARYPDLTSRHTLTLEDSAGNTIYSATQADDAEFDVGAIDASGTITWEYTVTDGTGGSATATGTITVLAYSPPSITGLVVQRYTSEVDDGGTIYVASEDGNHVWFSFTATASALNNLNSWSLSLLSVQEGATPGTPTTFETHAAGSTYSVTKTNDRTILTSEVSASTAWTFTVTITDGIDSASATFEIEEATAFFDVEENGVSVGMRATGTANDKKFEVAEDYTAHFYGGIATDCYEPGDTFEINSAVVLPGIVSGSTKTMYFTLWVDKSMENITSISCTRLHGTIRGDSGYVNGENATTGNKNYAATSGYTVTAYKISNYALTIRVVKSSAFTSITNNRPCTFFSDVGITLTFS